MNSPEDKKYFDYKVLLDEFGISYSDDGDFYLIGKPSISDTWLLFLSIRAFEGPQVLKKILLFLSINNANFKVIKTQLLHFQINAGMLWKYINGEKLPVEIRKCITVYPKSDEETQFLITNLLELTQSFESPEIPDAKKIGNILYLKHFPSQNIPINESHIIIEKKNNPFKYKMGFNNPKYRRKVYGKYFIPFQVIQESLKGIVLKAINIKHLSLTWCLIKIGYEYAMEDIYNRDSKSRLKWEMHALGQLSLAINVPKVLGYFEKKDYFCLITEYIEGTSLEETISQLLNSMIWRDIEHGIKIKILEYFLKIIDTVETIHKKGFIHRDVTPANFIIDKENNLFCIDFELSYSSTIKQPAPPFLLGTIGYASPEQLALSEPTPFEDTYALGGILLYFVTGTTPEVFDRQHKGGYLTEIENLSGDKEISQLIGLCRERDISSRISTIEEIRKSVEMIKIKIGNKIDMKTPSPFLLV